jgi:Zn-dependent metalloprotease
MKVQYGLLSAAIVSILAVSGTAQAAKVGGALKAGHDGAYVRAEGLLAGKAGKAAHRADADRFTPTAAIVDRDGTEHVRFNRTYRGLPVIGGDFVLHSKNGETRGVSGTLHTALRPGVTARIPASTALATARKRFGLRAQQSSDRLVVYALGDKPVLAREVVLHGMRADQTPSEMHYFYDANTGKLLRQWDAIETARPGGGGGGATCVAKVGSGLSLTEGTVALDTAKCGTQYQMKDLTRGGGYTTNMAQRQVGLGTLYTDPDNNWGNGTLSDSVTVAADAHYGVSVTWDYYLDVHGREGIGDDGVGALSRVHYGRNYQNAFWSDSCFCMTFGDGDNGVTVNPLIALDVAGHEMSHGVTSRSADLVYDGESGGLNEATSDIMGTMVEYYANNPNDPADYMIGEKVYPNNPGYYALRYMFQPSLDGYSPDCYSPGLGGLDVHYSSGVANHFYYLLAEGAVVPSGFDALGVTQASLVCNGNTTITGVGRDVASKIWYRALTVYMTSGSQYVDARAATLSAAADLYDDQDVVDAVAAAWDAVNVAAGT